MNLEQLPSSYIDAWLTKGAYTLPASLPGTESRWPKNILPLLQRDDHGVGLVSSRPNIHMWPRWAERVRHDAAPMTPYQAKALLFALSRRDAALWHCVGSGKTRTALTWGLLAGEKLLYLTRAMARRTTEAEVLKWTTVKSQVCLGRTATELDPDCCVYILGYEVAPYWLDMFRVAMNGNGWAIVMDESHHVKGWRRKSSSGDKNRAGAVKDLSLSATRRLTTTGTPIRNRVKDLWAELDLTEPGAWGSSYDFMLHYADARPTSYGGLDSNGESNVDELRQRIDTVVHRVGYAEVQRDMPEKVRTVVRIPESELLPLEKVDKTLLPAGGIARAVALAGLRKHSAVVDLIKSKLQEPYPYRKVTVFTYLRADCERIAQELALDLPWRVLTAHGGVSPDKRDAIRVEYMTETARHMILVGTGDAWGEAVSLNDTDVAVFSSLPMTPGQLEQYEGRFHRKGQTKKVEIVYVVGVGTSDESIATLLLDKLPSVEVQVGLGGAEATTRALETAIGMDDKSMTERLMSMILGDSK